MHHENELQTQVSVVIPASDICLAFAEIKLREGISVAWINFDNKLITVPFLKANVRQKHPERMVGYFTAHTVVETLYERVEATRRKLEK